MRKQRHSMGAWLVGAVIVAAAASGVAALASLYPPGVPKGRLSVSWRPRYDWRVEAGRQPDVAGMLPGKGGCVVTPGRGRYLQVGPVRLENGGG